MIDEPQCAVCGTAFATLTVDARQDHIRTHGILAYRRARRLAHVEQLIADASTFLELQCAVSEVFKLVKEKV